VLRAQIGQQFDIVCDSAVRVGTVCSVSDQSVEFSLGEIVLEGAERELLLLMAIYKFDRMEWAIEKCTELGATRILPVIARRTDSHLASAASKRVERWRRIAHEAAQQSRRVRPPVIDEPVKLNTALETKAESRLLLNENEEAVTLASVLASAATPIAFAIGPEGGWSEEELSRFSMAGWRSVSLGSTILRAETAAVAALAAAVCILE